MFGFFTEIHQEGMEYHFERDLTENERVSLKCTKDPISQSQEALVDDVRFQWRA